MQTVVCENYAQWREAARKLLANQVPPHQVDWGANPTQNLFAEPSTHGNSLPKQQYSVPKAFLSIAQSIACLRDPSKWARLYTVLWRLVFEDRNLLTKASDSDIRWINKACKAVGRDCHKMKAFVRFTKQVKVLANKQQDEWYVAWFEPDHLIVERMAQFFVKRFTGMKWAILTPDACCHWDMQELIFSPGVAKPTGLEDDLNQLWIAYYSNIFNPARIKINAMVKEMPKRYWKNLPEASVINNLLNAAGGQTQNMFDTTPIEPDALRNRSKALKLQQDALRAK